MKEFNNQCLLYVLRMYYSPVFQRSKESWNKRNKYYFYSFQSVCLCKYK